MTLRTIYLSTLDRDDPTQDERTFLVAQLKRRRRHGHAATAAAAPR